MFRKNQSSNFSDAERNNQIDQNIMPRGNQGEQEYHIGNLVFDRTSDRLLHRRASELLARAKRGEVHLFQRRIGENKFSYIFIEAKA